MTFLLLLLLHVCYSPAGCEPETCNIPNDNDQWGVENCRVQGLPDLNQTVPHVAETLHKWIEWVRDEYHIDGFRVDAAKHMPMVRLRLRRDVLDVASAGCVV